MILRRKDVRGIESRISGFETSNPGYQEFSLTRRGRRKNWTI
jgi:hypothetical protein